MSDYNLAIWPVNFDWNMLNNVHKGTECTNEIKSRRSVRAFSLAGRAGSDTICRCCRYHATYLQIYARYKHTIF